nr:putative ribonuclease H-like domain-containing protein [Tanacetum cinerariifolium]
ANSSAGATHQLNSCDTSSLAVAKYTSSGNSTWKNTLAVGMTWSILFPTRRNVSIETTNSSALVSCDELGGYYWNDQAKEGPNYALMAYSTSNSDSEVCLCLLNLNCLIGLEEFTSEPAVETLNAKTSEKVPKVVKKDNGALIIKAGKSDDEDESVPQPKVEKKIVQPSVAKRVNTVRNKHVNTARPKAVLNVVKGNEVYAVKASACNPKGRKITGKGTIKTEEVDFENMYFVHKIKDIKKLKFEIHCNEITIRELRKRGHVAFGGNPKGGKITGKGTIKTGELDFENMYFVKELKFNLFVSQMYDKKNTVLFNDTECVVLYSDFKLTDENHVLLRVPIKNNMYSVDLKNVIPKGGFTCYFAKATSDESRLWHRRLGHLNFKTMNKLVKGNLVRGLPLKKFENDQTRVACQKGKQHRASCKSKTENSISLPLHMLHMDLFGLTFVKSLMKKMHCLVVTDDYSRFTWVFFLSTKNETSGILKSFITRIENLVDHKVKVIRCDNRTEFKNKDMNQFCKMKGIMRQYSVARTPQQNGVDEKRDRTLIEATKTMLADSKLPTTFYAEAVSTACYVLNR